MKTRENNKTHHSGFTNTCIACNSYTCYVWCTLWSGNQAHKVCWKPGSKGDCRDSSQLESQPLPPRMLLAFIIWEWFCDVGASPPGTSWKSIKAIKVLSDVINIEPTKIWTTSELLAHRWQILHPIKNFLRPKTYCSRKRSFWMSFHSLNDKAENKRNISDGFINGFSVQSLYLLPDTVLSLRRFLAQTLLPSPWLLMVRPVLEPNNHDHRADLRRVL